MTQPVTVPPPVESNLPPALPATVATLAALHRARQQMLARRALATSRRAWAGVDPGHPRTSWARLVSALLAALSGLQREAARGVAGYVAAALRRQGVEPDPAGLVATSAFAGFTADGRPLADVLDWPAFHVEALVGQGVDPDVALLAGGRRLDRIVMTETQDAARVATGVAVVNDRTVVGFVRYLTPPSCSRCVLLAGKWYRFNQEFERHPQCDCVHVPAAEVIEPQSPEEIFAAMSDAELKKAGWSDADVSAIRDHGADIYQVTNAHQQLRSVTVAGQQLKATGAGVTRRGLAGQRLGARRKRGALRLTPASIYSEAARLDWSRDELIRVLKLHGYLI